MNVIMIESAAFQELVGHIEKIAEHIRKYEDRQPVQPQERWLTSKEVTTLLGIQPAHPATLPRRGAHTLLADGTHLPLPPHGRGAHDERLFHERQYGTHRGTAQAIYGKDRKRKKHRQTDIKRHRIWIHTR